MVVTSLWQDLRYSCRALRKSPLFLLAAALTLGLGIGVNTTVFSSLNGWMFRSLPVREPQSLVVVTEHDPASEFLQGPSYPDYLDYKQATRVFRDAAVFRLAVVGFHRGAVTDRLWLEAVSGNYFAMLGLAAAQGRLFGPAEERSAVLVLGYGTWAGRFGSDPSLIGATVRLDGQPYTIIGVAPKTFHGTISYVDSDGFVPLLSGVPHLPTEDRRERGYRMLARLQPGVHVEQAQAAASTLGAALAREYPAANRGVRPVVMKEPDSRPEPHANLLVRRMLVAGMALVGIVLLIASANIVNLLLVRAAKRSREWAIRAAIGAGRARLVRLVFTESLLVSLSGLAVGLALSSWVSSYLSSYQPGVDFKYRQDYSFDGAVFAFALAVTLLTTLVCGIFPALRLARADLNEVLKASAPARGSARQRLARTLVVAQVAASALLLICTGLFVKGLAQASNLDLGYQVHDRIVTSFKLPQRSDASLPGGQFIQRLLDRVNAHPGVRSAAFTTSLPFNNFFVARVFNSESEVADPQGGHAAMWSVVSPRYFATIGTPLISGREFTSHDDAHGRPVAIVNQAFANALWPGGTAIGKRFRIGPQGEAREVVGVAATAKYLQLEEPPRPWYFVPFWQEPADSGALVVESALPPADSVAQVREDFRSLDPELPVFGAMTLERLVQHSYVFGPPRVATRIAAAFSMLGLLLAGIGLYGVIAHSVAQRTKEIGIRLGLGADRAMIMRLVLRQGFLLIGCGLAIGIAAAVAVGGLIHRFVFGVNATDPATFAAATGVVLVTGLAACYFPSRAAASIDPAVALRTE